MGVKYVKDFAFPSSGGFHGDVQRYAKGGHVTKLPAKAKASAKGMPARAKPNAPARGAPKMESKPKMGKGQGYEKGGYVPGKEKDVLPTKRPPGMGKDLAPSKPFKGKYEGYADGGEVDRIPVPRGENVPVSPLSQMGNELPFDRTKYNNWYEDPRYLPQAPPEQPDRYIGGGDPIPSIPGNIGPEFPLMTTMPVPNRPRLRSEVVGRSPLAQMGLQRPASRVAQAARRRAMMDSEPRGIVNRLRDRIARRVEPKAPMIMERPRVNEVFVNPFTKEEIDEYSKGKTFSPAAYYAKGGEVKGKSKIAKVMGEYKRGELHSGSKKGPKVKSREQAVAIALSEARKAGAKIPKKSEGGEIYSTEYLAYGDKKGPYRGSPKKAKMLGRQDRRAREAMERAEKYAPGMSLDMPGKVVKKAKGGGFPDLTGDGKVTRADVLKGRGVFKKGGMAKHKDVKMDKAMMKKAVHKHEKAMHPGKKLTKLSDGGVPSYGRKPMYGGGKC